jgi:hypothetical protein
MSTQLTCPNCGKTTAVIRGKPEYGGGYVCWAKNGGCGHKWGQAPVVRNDESPERIEGVPKMASAPAPVQKMPLAPPPRPVDLTLRTIIVVARSFQGQPGEKATYVRVHTADLDDAGNLYLRRGGKTLAMYAAGAWDCVLVEDVP